MLTQTLWWSGLSLEVLLLARSFATKLSKAFPFFYSYVTIVLFTSASRFYVYQMHASQYQRWYWLTEIFSALVGYGVIFELYERTLYRFEGVRRFLRGVLLLALALGLINTFATPWSLPRLSTELEYNLRLIQTVLLIIFLALLIHYRIPMSRNTKGIAFGYGFFVGFKTIHSVFYSVSGVKFAYLLGRLYPVIYLTSLIIWSVLLWSRHLEPQTEMPMRIERDYESLVVATRLTLARARAYVARGVR